MLHHRGTENTEMRGMNYDEKLCALCVSVVKNQQTLVLDYASEPGPNTSNKLNVTAILTIIFSKVRGSAKFTL